MNEKEKILTENFAEYFDGGKTASKEKKYNTAVTLFFKSISAATDLFLLKKIGSIPSSHSNRFAVLREKYPEIYDILDRDFPFYQDSYTKKMDLEAADLLEEDAKRIKEISKI